MHASIRLAAAVLCAAAAASAVHAQVRRSITAVPNTAPSAAAQANQGAPSPSGLRPVFPAGIGSGSGAAVSSDPIAATTSPVPAGLSTIPAPGTGASGGSVNNGRIIPELPSPDRPAPGMGFSAADVIRSFDFADDNRDGTLTAAEAARLSIVTMTFREMDRNGDGVVSRSEYEASVL